MAMKSKYVYIVFIALIALIEPVNGQNISVIHADGSIRANLKTTIFKGPIQYISIKDFADIFNARSIFNVQNKKFIIYLEKKNIEVTAFNPFILIDKNVYQLPTDTKWKDGQVYVPVSYFLEIIDQSHRGTFQPEVQKRIFPFSPMLMKYHKLRIAQEWKGVMEMKKHTKIRENNAG